MCVGYAARIISLCPEQKYAEVECRGIQTFISVALLESFAPGDYVLAHAGVALEKISKDMAEEILAIQEELWCHDE